MGIGDPVPVMTTPQLARKITNAYVWTTFGNVVKNAAGFVIALVLAHLLGPKEYGLLGMAMVFTSILAMLQDFGVGQAVVYFQEERQALPLYFTAAAAVGGCLTALTFLLAPAMAAFYREPAITPVVRALSPILLFGSIYSVAQSALVREFDFRRVSLAELGGTLIGGASGIALAYAGFGVWALVANVLISLFLQMAAVSFFIRPRFTLRIDTTKLAKILRWGLPMTGGSLLWQGYENADYLVVGRMLGETPCGYYTLAFRLGTLVNSRVAAIINRVSFPTFSAVQRDHRELIGHWNSITERLGQIVFPLSALLAVNAHDVLLVVLGRKWLPAEVPLQLLCLVGALKPLVSTMGSCMFAIGQTRLSFRFCLTNAILLPVSFWAACRFAGINGVAAAWCIVSPLTFAWFLVRTVRLVNGSVREYARQLIPGIATTACGVAAMLLAGLPFASGFPRLAVRSAAGTIAILAAYWLHPPTRSLIQGFLLSRVRERSER